jgi:hypothetical protein
MRIILKIIRLICLPLKIITNLIYGSNTPPIAGYSWYNRAEYERMLKTAKDEDIISSYTQWKENAEQTISELRSRGWFVFKVRIKSSELDKWLRHQKLKNLHENRERFIGSKVSKFIDDPVI